MNWLAGRDVRHTREEPLGPAGTGLPTGIPQAAAVFAGIVLGELRSQAHAHEARTEVPRDNA